MDKDLRFVDSFSYVLGGVSLLVSFYIFFRNTGQFGGSLVAGIMTGILVWLTYLMVRWLLLANRG
jgi:hypothetical protein